MQHRFQLGETVQCIITGCKGVAVARFEYLNGCIRYRVQPRELKDGGPVDSLDFDEEQFDHCDEGDAIVEPIRRVTGTGGDQSGPKKDRAPSR